MESNHRDGPMGHKNQTKECSFQHYYSITLEYTLERNFSFKIQFKNHTLIIGLVISIGHN